MRKLGDGRYELDRPLARGGMGEVWLGRDTKLDREIAVKFIRMPDGGAPEPEQVRRFVRESRITARLRHPGVPAVYDGGTDEHGWPFLVMQRVHGISVADLIFEQGPLPIGWTAAIAAQVCAVLAAAHAASLIHRDLKPSNLMLEPDGCVKVLDFGLAVAPTLAGFSRITITGQPLGSPPYMAPEQVEANQAEPATDIYALGCTIHEMVTGAPVFSGNTSISAEAVYARLLPFVERLGPIVGVLDHPAKSSPIRQYAEVVSRVFADDAEMEHAPANEATPVVRELPAEGAEARTLRAELRKAHTDAHELVRKSRFRQAADALGEVTSRAAESFGARDDDVLRARHDLAAALFDGGDYRRAAPLYRALAQDLAGTARAELRYDCRLKEATCHALTGHTPEAIRQLSELLADQRKAGDGSDPRTLELRKQIGLLLLGAGRRAEAQETLTRLLADLRRSPGTGPPDPDEIAGLLTSVGLIAADSTAGEQTHGTCPLDEEWFTVLRLVNDPGIRNLLRPLAARRLPTPTVGYELGDEGWPAEIAWPGHQVAILWADPPDDPETVRRNRAYSIAGWDARTADRWTADDIAERIAE